MTRGERGPSRRWDPSNESWQIRAPQPDDERRRAWIRDVFLPSLPEDLGRQGQDWDELRLYLALTTLATVVRQPTPGALSCKGYQSGRFLYARATLCREIVLADHMLPNEVAELFDWMVQVVDVCPHLLSALVDFAAHPASV